MSIIRSRLDIDMYKFKMLYFLWLYKHIDTPVIYRFFNRTNINLYDYISSEEVKMEINNFSKKLYTSEELKYLSTIFQPEFIKFLYNQNLSDVKISIPNKGFSIDIEGTYGNVILYETAILSIINELISISLTHLILISDLSTFKL